MTDDDAVEPSDRWVRGPLRPRVALVVVPVTLLGALLAALVPIGDLGALLQAWVWTLVAGGFGVAAAWLIAVMLVPYLPDDAPGLGERRDLRESE